MKITLSILAGIGFLVIVVAAVIGIALCPWLTSLLLLLSGIIGAVAVLLSAFAVGLKAYDRMTVGDKPEEYGFWDEEDYAE